MPPDVYPPAHAELEKLRRAGEVGAETRVWWAGLADWVPLSRLLGSSPARAAAGPGRSPQAQVLAPPPIESVVNI